MSKEVKNNFWVWFGYILILFSLMIPNEGGVLVCCSGIFVLFLGYSIKNQAKKNQLLVIQSPAFQPSPILVSPPPFVQQQPPPKVVINQSTTSEAINFNEDNINWEEKARNLEIARDWEKSAEAYQKAGLFSEAGRIRKEYLEKDDSQVKIHVDRIGHNIQDSVYMEESENK